MGGFGGRGAGVDCGHDGEVVLVFVEVGGCRGVGFVEGVEEGGVEGAEGEFVDDVGEVECWILFSPSSAECSASHNITAVDMDALRWKRTGSTRRGSLIGEERKTYQYDPNAARTPYSHVPSP